MKAALPARWALPMFTAAWLSGCASLRPDGGFAPVQEAATQHLGKELRWARAEADQQHIDQRVATLLAQPLQAGDAVQLALLNNRGLQATFQELDIADAERVQAGRLSNPGISVGRLTRGSEVEVETSLHFNLARLLLMPWTSAMESRRVQQTQGAVALRVLALAADARKAHVNALAAEETLRYARQVMQAADAGAELARRMQQVGNFSTLQRARQQAFYADAALAVAHAAQTRHATRERLTRLLGLWGEQAQRLQLPERLPDLPDLPDQTMDQRDIEQRALAQRMDVQGARLAAAQTAASLGLTRSTRVINVLELGLQHNRSNQEPTQRGWELTLELPLFDAGTARVARAEAVYMQALHQAADVAINARSEVREAYVAYRSAYDIARHHLDEIVPLRQRIAEENLLRYNGMLISVFELLADTRAQIGSVAAAINAKRDFWLAQADLEWALIGKPGPMAPAAAGSSTAAAAAEAGH